MPDSKLAVPRDASAPASVRTPFATLRHEIDRLFDDFGWPSLPAGRLAALEPFRDRMLGFTALPPTDMIERDDAYEVRADLPGFAAGDIEVRLADGVLTIRGERAQATDEDKAGYHLRERSSGALSRTLRLPSGIDPDRVKARFADGVLTVTLPRSAAAEARSRRIDIQAA